MSEQDSKSYSVNQILKPDLSPDDLIKIKVVGRQMQSERRRLQEIRGAFDEKHAGAIGQESDIHLALIDWTLGENEEAMRIIQIIDEAKLTPATRAELILIHAMLKIHDHDVETARNLLADAQQILKTQRRSSPLTSEVQTLIEKFSAESRESEDVK